MGLFIRFAFIAVLAYALAKLLKKIILPLVTPLAGSQPGQARGENSRGDGSSRERRDPYEVLGISPGSSRREIIEAYKKALKEYHPDKVAHLGPDLRELAAKRTEEIIVAYNSL